MSPAGGGARGSKTLLLAGLGVVVLVFYLVEASLRKTPWDFTDELEWSQLSRAIASTGHAARRTEPHSFESLYAFLIAPMWWIHSTATAYAAIKYLNAVVMSLASIPVYLLARMLLSRRASLVVALLSIAIPAMAYATSIVPEPLAYPWFTLEALFAVRLLAAPSVGRAVPAVFLALVGVLVRSEFVALTAALVLAGAIAWIVERGGSWRDRWRAIALSCVGLAVFGYVFNVLVVEREQAWQFGQYFNRHTIHEGGLAAGALAIGLGLGPVVGGLASLWLPERFADRNYRAFAVYLLSTILALCLYTSAKATYLLTNLRPAIEERNLFFLSPLLLIGTALVLFARRVNWWIVGAATLLVLATAWSGMFEVGAPYFEAPGLDIVTITNRYFYWDINDFHFVLIGAAVIFVLLLLFRRRRWVPVAAVVLGAAWLLTGEVYATVGNTDYANSFAKMIPAPRNWVDEATHGAHVTFLGQGLGNGSGSDQLWLTEFWNRSIDHVASLDGTAPGPGPTSAPGLETTDGALSDYTGDPYTVVGNGIQLAAPIVAQRDGLVLYSTPKTWHLLNEEQNLWTDGWAVNPYTYTYFPRGGPGVLTVKLSRTAWKGPGRPGRATIRVGTVGLDQNGVPELKRLLAVRRVTVPNGSRRVVQIPVAATPVTVDVVVEPTIKAPGDPRKLAVQPAVSFQRS